MEVDFTVLVGRSTTCWYRSQISFPIPSQATKLNILKAPATGAQGTPIPAESTVPLRKGPPTQPNSRLPLRRLLRQTHLPRNQPAPPVLFYPQSLAPPLRSARDRAASRVGEGSARARAAPAQTMPGRAERAPGRPEPNPANTHPCRVSRRSAGPAGRCERTRGRCESGRSSAEPPRHEAPATPEPAEAQGSAEPARPSLSALHVSSRGGAGRGGTRAAAARARGPGGGTCRDVGGARTPAGAGAEAGRAGAVIGGGPDSDPGRCCRTAWGVCMLVLAKAPSSFIIFLPRRWQVPASSLTEYSFCRHM